jgi:DNA-binding IclR family transcriptional regulator/nitroimidazol reductase NimA-like FMN-containing flavoprotein (pyridoxamine 5'-phosphate oxidase superfamily)
MPGSHVPAVVRALTLMEALAAAPHGLSAGALEQVDDGSRSGMFALLSTLRDREWLAQDDRGRYLLGPAVRRLAPNADDDEALAIEALAAALESGSRPDETVLLLVPDPDGPRVVACHPPGRVVHAHFRVGDRRPATSAPARLLAADYDPALEQVRSSGVAAVREAEMVEVAAPVCRDGHRPDAVISVVVPRQRASPGAVTTFRDDVRSLAAEVSRRLGASSWQPWGAATTTIGTARTLGDDEVRALLNGRFGAQLGCLTDEGTPHVVPLWFEYDDDHLWLAASPGSSWARYVGSGAPVSLTVEEPWPNLRRVFIQGHAEPLDDDRVTTEVVGGIAGLRARLAQRYLGSGAAIDDSASSDGWSVVKVTPTRIIGRAGLQAVPQ